MTGEIKIELSANLDFDISKNVWEMLIDRLNQLFIANEVTSTNEKRAILFSKVNADTYEEVAKVLCEAKDSTYDKIVKEVTEYLKPPASYLVHRYGFRQRKHLDSESIAEYVAALKVMADKYQFTNLNGQTLDQMICGLKSKVITAEVLKIEQPTLETALKNSGICSSK